MDYSNTIEKKRSSIHCLISFYYGNIYLEWSDNMLYMMIVKASSNSEGANIPNKELMLKMDEYNDELIAAGVRVMAKGLHPSSEGYRLSFPIEQNETILTAGPFKPEKDVVAGLFLIEVSSHEEAMKWFLKVPDPQGNGEGQVELRQVY